MTTTTGTAHQAEQMAAQMGTTVATATAHLAAMKARKPRTAEQWAADLAAKRAEIMAKREANE